MTLNEFKHSDLYSCLKITKELIYTSAQFCYSVLLGLFKFTFWVGKKTYNYIAK